MKKISKNLKREKPFAFPPRAALNLDNRVSNTLLKPNDSIFKGLNFKNLIVLPFDVKKNVNNRFIDKLSFKSPSVSPICKSRKDRRRALFASGIAGNIKVKKAKWTSWSNVSC